MKYIKDERTEDEKMLDIIHRNHDTIRMNRLIDKELNRNRKENNIKLYGIIAVVIIFIISIISLLWIYSEKQVDNCVKAGHDKEWCIVNG